MLKGVKYVERVLTVFKVLDISPEGELNLLRVLEVVNGGYAKCAQLVSKVLKGVNYVKYIERVFAVFMVLDISVQG